MILSRLFLNPLSREVQRCMGDVQRLHARVLDGFAEGGRHQNALLFRPEFEGARAMVLVQSSAQPDWSRLPSGFLMDLDEIPNPDTRDLRAIVTGLRDGARFRFKLRANATRKIDTRSGRDGKRRHGRRVPVRGDDGRSAWLERKGRQHGFVIATPGDLPALAMTESADVRGIRDGRPLTLSPVTYEGVLVVSDVALFGAALRDGVGPAKAYGFGLLTVAPA